MRWSFYTLPVKKVILDENVPRPLRNLLAGHAVTTVQKEGWAGIGNGELIANIDGVFDVFVTSDKNLRYQQNLKDRKIAIIELPFNAFDLVLPLAPMILAAINDSQPNDYLTIEP